MKLPYLPWTINIKKQNHFPIHLSKLSFNVKYSYLFFIKEYILVMIQRRMKFL